jgi:RNA polymerase sigma-70 factor, ECF subfamily
MNAATTRTVDRGSGNTSLTERAYDDPMALGAQFETVLGAARAGSEWALALFYRDLQPALLRYLRVQEAAEAEDLASEVWLDVAAGIGRFEGDEASFRRWFFTIARRRLLDWRRQRGRRQTDPVPPTAFVELASAVDVEAEALGAISMQEALARIASLPAAESEVIALRVIAGLDASDVAALTGRTPGGVRVLQHRALKRLAAVLSRMVVTL